MRPRGLALAFALLLSLAAPAWADVWGYIDAQGVAHFAAEPVDERYELYYRSNQDDALRSQGRVRNLGNGATPGAEKSRLLAFFEVSPGYKAVQHLLREAADLHQLDPELLKALIATESGFDARAVSPKGAVGLMQLMPMTAERYGVKPNKAQRTEQLLTDPRINLFTGARVLRSLLDRYPGQLDLALAAYNAGEGAVLRAGNTIPPYKETQNYVKTVLQLHALLQPPPAVAQQKAQAQAQAQQAQAQAKVQPPVPVTALVPTQVGGAAGRGNMIPPLAAPSPLGVVARAPDFY